MPLFFASWGAQEDQRPQGLGLAGQVHPLFMSALPAPTSLPSPAWCQSQPHRSARTGGGTPEAGDTADCRVGVGRALGWPLPMPPGAHPPFPRTLGSSAEGAAFLDKV